MKAIFLLIIPFTSLLIISCASNSVSHDDLTRIQNELYSNLKDPTIRQLKYVVETDLQFEKGCRGQNISVESCDFTNTLSVSFETFKCRSNLDPENLFSNLSSLNDGGARCDYKGIIHWPDGRTERLEEKDELYRLEYYSENQSHEYRWRNVRE